MQDVWLTAEKTKTPEEQPEGKVSLRTDEASSIFAPKSVKQINESEGIKGPGGEGGGSGTDNEK